MTTPSIPGLITSDGGRRNMLLLLGAPFTGKSTAAATFPNAIFLDFDHKAPPGTNIIPFWDAKFCDTYAPRTNPNNPPNKRDALINFLKRELSKLPPETTLVLDSMTMVDAAFHQQTERVETVPVSPKTGKPDGFYVWGVKLRYYGALFDILKNHPGNVIVIMHEQYERDEDGKLSNTIKPLLSGSFVDSIASHFTLVFRSRIIPGDPAKGEKTRFVWDVKPNRAFPCNNCLSLEQPTVPAHYDSIKEAAEKLNK